MKFFPLLNSIAKKEKPALLFFLKLLILLCVIKSVFFFYNYSIADGWALNTTRDFFRLLLWSLLSDSFAIALINLPLFLLLLITGKFLKSKAVKILVALLFTILNTFSLFLNTTDIFYFRFHLQRADADLLYVLRNPFENSSIAVLLVVLAAISFFTIAGSFIYKNLWRIIQPAAGRANLYITSSLLVIFFAAFIISGSKKIVPTYPLTTLKPVQLPLAQNSFHTFLYSLYRRNEMLIPDKNYMPADQQRFLFSIHKKNNTAPIEPKNIVLFIMESIPSDFFDSSSPYKVAMPFLDSLVNKSSYFNNAFSYSYSSNKGITSLLAGIPTMTDIPLYHSRFVSINHTAVGDELAKQHYSSAFFIGDNYDDFGFAQCCKWLGIQQYYCMEDIPGYQLMEKHSLGLHDEYVLNFMGNKLNHIKEPFFAVQYNISTHYPNDLPATFKDRFPEKNTTPQMKTMQYYNDCLQQFFANAATQSWFRNTVFIFCSDHWAQPHNENIRTDEVESFRIPIFIYDPATERKEIISSMVSQLDIMNTILYYGGSKDSLVSYGSSLKDTILNPHRTIFTKTNSAIYHAINEEYVVGFDAMGGKAVYCYAYKKDPERKNDLLKKPHFNGADSLILEMKAYLQTASRHYRNKTN
ncbi:MAG: LTA synthase family protein [Chitinophagaceae bacterium]|nr:LTA synthase family protein [Chitinophagaceae bacterium]